MSFATMALIGLAALVGPLLALPVRWHVPVLLGELLAGMILGPTVLGVLHASNPTFKFLADMGFALVMFVAGSHVPVRDTRLRPALLLGCLRAVGVGIVAAALGAAISGLFHTGHALLYVVLMGSSSAALVLPLIESVGLSGSELLPTMAQVAIADTVCIVALPLVIDPSHAGRAALGAVVVIGAAAVLFVLLDQAERGGQRRRVHRISERRKFALELRVSLVVVFALAALAVRTHVSIMLAGFALGLVVAAVGEPRRLARQLFAVADGFLGPLFFVWLGASINLRELAHHPAYIFLGLLLGLGAVVSHGAPAIFGQPLALGALASAQLGVPIAAATIGSQEHVLHSGEAPALLFGALITIAAATIGGSVAARAAAEKRTAGDPPDRSAT